MVLKCSCYPWAGEALMFTFHEYPDIYQLNAICQKFNIQQSMWWYMRRKLLVNIIDTPLPPISRVTFLKPPASINLTQKEHAAEESIPHTRLKWGLIPGIHGIFVRIHLTATGHSIKDTPLKFVIKDAFSGRISLYCTMLNQ